MENLFLSSPYFGSKPSDSDSEAELSCGSRSALSSPSSSVPTTPPQPQSVAQQFTDCLKSRIPISSLPSVTPSVISSFDTQKSSLDSYSNQQVLSSDNSSSDVNQTQDLNQRDLKFESITKISPKGWSPLSQ